MSDSSSNGAAACVKCDPGQLEKGDWVTRISYCRVVDKERNGSFRVENERGFSWTIAAGIVAAECVPASHFDIETPTTRTEMAHRLERAGASAFQVCFEKQATQKAVADRLGELDADAAATPAKRRRLAKELMAGEERVLVGRLATPAEPLDASGRVRVIDLEVERGAHNRRLVDPRTLRWLVVDGVRYTLKK